MPDFTGKTCVITGAASGLGRETAVLMAQAGANVVVLDLDAAGLGETEAACLEAGHEVLTMSVDVTKGDSLAVAADATRERFGAIHALINSAGTLGPSVPIVDCDEADWQRVFDVNVKGTFLAAKYYIALLRKGGGGAIVNFSSAAGLVGSNELGPYSASKGAVVLMTRSMALNHASEGIRVNCVCPASIDTPMLRATFEIAGDEEARRKRYEKFLQRHPLGRFGTASEVARAVLFLASDDASFITGAALPVDGGRLA